MLKADTLACTCSSVGAVMFDLVGLQQPADASAAGWTNALLWPTVTDQAALPYASGSLASIAGTYITSWYSAGATQCADSVPENTVQTISCPGGAANVIKSISFASFGTPGGSCGNYTIDNTCNAANSSAIISSLCLGKTSCVVNASDTIFGALEQRVATRGQRVHSHTPIACRRPVLWYGEAP